MNKFEAMKAVRDGLDAWEDIQRHAAEGTAIEAIPEDDLQRMKWYGVFHRPQAPGTFMMRLRVPAGRLTAAQLRTIAGIATRFGHGSVDLTTRQNVQLRGILLSDVPEIVRGLDAAGLSSLQTGLDNVRNFVGCPLAGIDGTELLDTTDLIAELGNAYLGNRELSNLPRKFNVAIAGCREDCGKAQTQDLGFIPATKSVDGQRVAGFNVLVGGALGGTSPRLATPLDVFVQPHEVVPLFLSLLRIFRDHGSREVRTKARLKWLVADWGEERLRGAVAAESSHAFERAGADDRLCVGGDHLGVHAQRQVGTYYVGLHVPVGRITAGQLEALSDLAEDYGRAEVRLTADQNVIIPHVAEARVGDLLAERLLRELDPDPGPAWRNLVACTGNDYCHYSLIDTKTRAVELARELERRETPVPAGTRIHVSGCIHACGQHHVGDIGLQGANVRLGGEVVEAADLFVGGRLGEHARLAVRVGEKVPMANLADVLDRLLRERTEPGTTAGEAIPALAAF